MMRAWLHSLISQPCPEDEVTSENGRQPTKQNLFGLAGLMLTMQSSGAGWKKSDFYASHPEAQME